MQRLEARQAARSSAQRDRAVLKEKIAALQAAKAVRPPGPKLSSNSIPSFATPGKEKEGEPEVDVKQSPIRELSNQILSLMF